ncbi:Sentrin-specific protease [Arachis hypogaea]|nr:Sentrin-specific protease [Arachis hypogaea]
MKYPTSEVEEKSSMKDKSTLLDKAAEATDVVVSLASVVAKGADDEVRSLEEKTLNVLNTIQEHVLVDRDVTKTILKTHNDQLRTMTELLEDHDKAIQDDHGGDEDSKSRLAASLRTGRRKPGKVDRKMKTPQENKSSTSQKTLGSSSERKSPCCTVKHEGPPRQAAAAETKVMSMKRKLTFEDLDSTSSPGSDLRQTQLGTPFTYHTHHGHHVLEPVVPSTRGNALRREGTRRCGIHILVGSGQQVRLRMREVLVEDENSCGDRGALLTLRLGQMVVEDVINLVCTMLTHEDRKESWFLPTTFSQVALSPVNHSIDTFEYIRSRFMGYADDLWMIYVPMHRDNHWYLMVVDLVNCNLLYLDSAKDSNHRESRVSQMKNDCGDVNDHTRMRLALDLVMGAYNPIARDVGRRAVRNWDSQMQRSTNTAKKGRKKVAQPASPSQSITI